MHLQPAGRHRLWYTWPALARSLAAVALLLHLLLLLMLAAAKALWLRCWLEWRLHVASLLCVE